MFILTNHIKPHKMRFEKHKTTLRNFFTEKENLAELCLLLLPIMANMLLKCLLSESIVI